jgi:hypothetical protein
MATRATTTAVDTPAARPSAHLRVERADRAPEPTTPAIPAPSLTLARAAGVSPVGAVVIELMARGLVEASGAGALWRVVAVSQRRGRGAVRAAPRALGAVVDACGLRR